MGEARRARIITLNSQHPLLILPRSTGQVHRDTSIRNAPGMTAFWPWCYVCNKRVPDIQKVEDGSLHVGWIARCHGDEMVIRILKGAAGSSQFQRSRVDSRVKFLTFFAPDNTYGGTHAKWTAVGTEAKTERLSTPGPKKETEWDALKKMLEGAMKK